MRFALAAAAVALAGCTTGERWGAVVSPVAVSGGADWYGDSATKMRWLNQGWSPAQKHWFANATQGSQLLPLVIFKNIEQASSEELFNAERNIRRYRMLTHGNDHDLPVGFVADRGSTLPSGLRVDRRSVGLTCAACHTTQINYRGTALLIDGGPTLADFQGFLAGLTRALEATAGNEAKFDRFAHRVLGAAPVEEQRAKLRAALEATATERRAYERLNASHITDGFGRLDAFGRIFNRVLTLAEPSNRIVPYAPVSYPFIWDAPWADRVQWTGNAPNGGLGNLGRNVGEVVGVFAAIEPLKPLGLLRYRSTVHIPNLNKIEKRLRTLRSPRWPEDILGALDPAKKARGAEIYRALCVQCHAHRGEAEEETHFLSELTPLRELRTDPLAAQIIDRTKGRTGIMEGQLAGLGFGFRSIRAVEPAEVITRETVTRLIYSRPLYRRPRDLVAGLPLTDKGLSESLNEAHLFTTSGDVEGLRYRARPLNGIWATAPYLHNGSVPNLDELLRPEHRRSERFAVGRREFDPERVGFRTQAVPGTFVFDTRRAGNRNTGHSGRAYGTTLGESDRAALLEYLKSL